MKNVIAIIFRIIKVVWMLFWMTLRLVILWSIYNIAEKLIADPKIVWVIVLLTCCLTVRQLYKFVKNCKKLYVSFNQKPQKNISTWM